MILPFLYHQVFLKVKVCSTKSPKFTWDSKFFSNAKALVRLKSIWSCHFLRSCCYIFSENDKLNFKRNILVIQPPLLSPPLIKRLLVKWKNCFILLFVQRLRISEKVIKFNLKKNFSPKWFYSLGTLLWQKFIWEERQVWSYYRRSNKKKSLFLQNV